MPFSVPVSVHVLSQDEFRDLDFEVMKHAFACQKELRRACDEAIYRNDKAARLAAAGFAIRKELRVLVSHRDFHKPYLIDLLVNDCAIYEMKAASSLVPKHDAQLLNYLFILGLERGKLVNFRTPSVESRFVNATVSAKAQRDFRLVRNRWQPHSESDRTLLEILHGLCADWGVYLVADLYREALVHFLGGEHLVVRPIPLTRDGVPLGQQKIRCAR